MEENQPIINKIGTQFWYQNGQKHRDNDQPAVILGNGTKKMVSKW